jgi:hypothetical protein
MASTQITVENLTVIPIYALLTWAGEHIRGVVIQAPTPDADGMYDREDFRSGSIPCEYVWYDLSVSEALYGAGVAGANIFATKQGIRGGTSWIFEPAGGGYQLRQR